MSLPPELLVAGELGLTLGIVLWFGWRELRTLKRLKEERERAAREGQGDRSRSSDAT